MSKSRRKRSGGQADKRRRSDDYIEQVARAAQEADEKLDEALSGNNDDSSEEEPVNTDSWTKIGSEADMVTDQDDASDTEDAASGSEPEAEDETGSDPEAEAEVTNETGSEAVPEAEAEVETETGSEPEPEAEPEPAPRRKTPPVPEPDESPEIRRQIRHKRRVRNQIIAYVSVALFIIALAVGISVGVHELSGVIRERFTKEDEEIVEETPEDTAPEEVILTPDEPEEPEVTEEEYDEEIVEMTSEDYLEEMVTSTIAQMPVEDKVAQLFLVTPEALTGVNAATQAGEGTKEALAEYAVGGLIYDRRNILDDDQFSDLLTNTRNMSKYELFLGVNEAGGEYSTLSGSELGDIPSTDAPADIAASGDSTAAYNAGATISSYLTYYGINLDMTPNGSVTALDDSVSAGTSFGSDEAVSYEMISRMIEGLQSGNVNACMTDFPGTGDITESTADGRVDSEVSADVMSARIVPYITGVTAGAKMIQLNNVTYINADPESMPASMSKYVIEDLIRDGMGFDGVIISGPLNEKAVTEYYTSEDAALYAYAAGVDMIYMPEDFQAAYNSILSAVQDGTIPESRIDLSLERIFRIKLAGYVE